MLQKCCKNVANMLQKCCKNVATYQTLASVTIIMKKALRKPMMMLVRILSSTRQVRILVTVVF